MQFAIACYAEHLMAALGSTQPAQIAARLLHTTVDTVVQLCMCWLRRMARVYVLVLVWWQQRARAGCCWSRREQEQQEGTHVHARALLRVAGCMCLSGGGQSVQCRLVGRDARGGWLDRRVQHLPRCGCGSQLHGALHP
jgi:hypothetical protein